MACNFEQSNSFEFSNNSIKNNSQQKNITAATVGIKKLLKSMRKIFKKQLNFNMSSSPSSNKISPMPTPLEYSYCMSEEEHQNWLNEQQESVDE